MGIPRCRYAKKESRNLKSAIRQILLEIWDPIGIADEPNAQDEYDGYIPQIQNLLSSQASIDELMAYLFVVVDMRMGMSPPAMIEHMRPTAEALKRLRLEQ